MVIFIFLNLKGFFIDYLSYMKSSFDSTYIIYIFTRWIRILLNILLKINNLYNLETTIRMFDKFVQIRPIQTTSSLTVLRA